MNKSGFIKELQNRTGYTAEQCTVINEVMESHFIFRKKNKPAITADLTEKLSIGQAEAERIYELSMAIIRSAKKDALKRPFGERK